MSNFYFFLSRDLDKKLGESERAARNEQEEGNGNESARRWVGEVSLIKSCNSLSYLSCDMVVVSPAPLPDFPGTRIWFQLGFNGSDDKSSPLGLTSTKIIPRWTV